MQPENVTVTYADASGLEKDFGCISFSDDGETSVDSDNNVYRFL